MADDKPTEDTTEEVVTEDTSTNEGTQDTEAELEAIEVSPDDLASDETEESEESTEDESADDSTEETEEESADDAESQDSTDEESSEETTLSEEDKEKQAKAAFEQREAKRKADKAKSQTDYLEGAEDDRDLALRQLQVDAYNNKIEFNSNKLQNGLDKAVAAIDLFNTGSPEVKDELSNSLDDFERMYVKRDDNGDPIEVTGDVYQFLQNKADSIKRLTGIGARQQVNNKAKQRASTLTPPAKTPKKPKVDPDLEAFDEEAGL